MTPLSEIWMDFCDDCLSTVDWLARCRCDQPIELAKARVLDHATPRAGVRPTLLSAAIRAAHPQEIPALISERLAQLGTAQDPDQVLYPPV